jgi:epoxyqueuosine reductase
MQYQNLADKIKTWALELGFDQAGITDTELSEHENYLNRWLENNFHGDMTYMEKHGTKRSRPAELIPGTLRIISVRMNYAPEDPRSWKNLTRKEKAAISCYAWGRDYHKVLKQRLQKLADKIQHEIGSFGYRAFVDSAPVLEKAIAQKAGLGWIGKNTLVINRKAGSFFFLGEIYTDLPLPIDEPASAHCGSCTACQTICPTNAFVGPYQLDARRCISYLTIENKNSIPLEFRKLIGNRIFGCDDCQLICPWNKFARPNTTPDFAPRHHLNNTDLVDLFLWSEEVFLEKTAGSAIRRTGYVGWLRNIAVALGNAPKSEEVIQALTLRLSFPDEIVIEHVKWALAEHGL